MSTLLPANRRAEKFAALVDATSSAGADEPYAPLLEVVGILRVAAALDVRLRLFSVRAGLLEALCALDGGPGNPPGGKPMRRFSTARATAA